MAEDNFTLTTFYTFLESVPGSHQRGACAAHRRASCAACRAAPALHRRECPAHHRLPCWLVHLCLGEDWGDEGKAYADLDDPARLPERPPSWCRPSTAPGRV